jgi:hypothetical protein
MAGVSGKRSFNGHPQKCPATPEETGRRTIRLPDGKADALAKGRHRRQMKAEDCVLGSDFHCQAQ